MKSVGPPWVAHLVWPIPETPLGSPLLNALWRLVSLPDFLWTSRR